MTFAYLTSSGIDIWEGVGRIDAMDLETLTLLATSIDDAPQIWRRLASHTRTIFPYIKRWHTVGYLVNQSKTQQAKLLNILTKSVGAEGVVRKNPITGIFYTIEDVSEKLGDLDLSALALPKYTALMFFSSINEDLEHNIFEALDRVDRGLTAANICDILQGDKTLTICRVIDSETHFVVQYCGGRDVIRQLLSVMRELDVSKISEADVAVFLNG